MGQKLNKFFLLMWKDFLIQWRHPFQTLIEILAPVIFALMMVVLRSLVYPGLYPAAFFLPFDTKMPNITNYKIMSTLAWSPKNPFLEKVMDETVKAINDKNNVSFFNHRMYNDSELMNQYLSTSIGMTGIFAGIQFNDTLNGDVELTPNIAVTFRFPAELRTTGFLSSIGLNRLDNWRTNEVFPIYQIPGARSPKRNDGGPPSYGNEGFLMLQEEVSFSIIKYFKKTLNKTDFDRSSVPIFMQRFPYPKYTKDVLLTALQVFVGLIFMLSFVYTCISTVKIISREKENQLKEVMKIMGLPNWLHWTAWFTKSFLMLNVTLILMIILLKARWYPNTDFTIFTYSDPIALFVFLLLYASATITFSFAISVFFSKANTAATFAGVAWFLSYFPYMFYQNEYDSLNLSQKLFHCLFSNSAMAYGFQLIIRLEGVGEGIQWHTIWRTTADDDFALGHVFIVMGADILIYLLIALYVEAVFPGDYGVPQPWYFPFSISYWCSKPQYSLLAHDFNPNAEEFENEPTHLEPGIQIRELRKTFRNKKVAVRDLSLNIYKDQITVLLGHNGAGKTTTMSMLTGMIRPTNGTAVVGGFDIRTNMEGVRNSLGLCPQHNILFDELTVKEHLYFYCRLKDLPKSTTYDEIEKYLTLLELKSKANAYSSTLSGGMKRKLSIGVALCGGSKVVMCDEPTAGMDPSARRALWDFLQSQKKGRTILLSTHFMDEADLLGDRIAIMAGGKLQCTGSSYFLKNKYGAGYHLIMDKSSDCDTDRITQLLHKYIPNIKVDSNIGSELSYLLSTEYSRFFENMFKELEIQSEELGIRSYGVSLTTLEEVFMKVGADHGQEEANDAIAFGNENNLKIYDPTQNTDDFAKIQVPGNEQHLLTGVALWSNQLLAMFMKRSLSIVRNWILFAIQTIIPVLFLILVIIILSEMDGFRNLPKLIVRLERYVDPITVITRTTNNKYSETYMDYLEKTNKSFINWESQNLTMNIMEEAQKNASQVNTRYIIGATFNKDNSIVAWFNNQPYHGAPLALQTVMNSILQSEISPNYYIQIYNHPLPYTLNTKFLKLEQANSMGFQIAFNLGFSMAFVSSFYVMFYIRERACKSKHLQFLSGVDVLSFWLPAFFCDMLTFIITSLCIIITFAIFQEDGFSTAEELGRLFTVLLLFGFASIPLMYLASYFYDIPSTGFTKMTLINIFTGVGAFLLIEILYTKELEVENVANILNWIFLLVPNYALCSAIRNMNLLYTTHKLCDTAINTCSALKFPNWEHMRLPQKLCKYIICKKFTECCTTTQNYFDIEFPGIGRNLIFFSSIGILCIALVLFLQYGIVEIISNKWQKNYVKLQPIINVETEDADVSSEREEVTQVLKSANVNKYTLLMCNVTKYYKKFLAVNNLTLGVKKGECFGLLGVNGAGKTTTFKMMTGDIAMSSGNAWINGTNLRKDLKRIYRLIGYCPQFDALLDDLTAKETLVMFALLRGVPKNRCEDVVHKLSHQFDFNRHLKKQIKELSGGNKRKVSTALALIGNPQVVYLDEPSTGMDPATKRHLWNALCKVRDSGKCIVLTSHSMEECEALCTRLAIMVNGSFKCLGSTQHLKSKFSDGYTLTIKARKNEESEIKEIENFVAQNFDGVQIREKHQELITFYITDRSQPWSKMFGILEQAKTTLNIEDYSLGQSSLEQVFLTFTKYQREE